MTTNPAPLRPACQWSEGGDPCNAAASFVVADARRSMLGCHGCLPLVAESWERVTVTRLQPPRELVRYGSVSGPRRWLSETP